MCSARNERFINMSLSASEVGQFATPRISICARTCQDPSRPDWIDQSSKVKVSPSSEAECVCSCAYPARFNEFLSTWFALECVFKWAHNLFVCKLPSNPKSGSIKICLHVGLDFLGMMVSTWWCQLSDKSVEYH